MGSIVVVRRGEGDVCEFWRRNMFEIVPRENTFWKSSGRLSCVRQ